MAVLITAGQRPITVESPQAPPVASVPLLTQARLCHLTASRMIAALDAQLTRLDAIPVADWDTWDVGTIDYNHARYRFPDEQRPSWWPWRPSLRDALYQSYGVAIQLRGKIMDQEKLWRQCFPVEAALRLDDRAYLLRVDVKRDWAIYRVQADDPPRNALVRYKRKR